MRNNSYAPHYAISIYSIREFKTGAEPFMVGMIIIIIIINTIAASFRQYLHTFFSSLSCFKHRMVKPKEKQTFRRHQFLLTNLILIAIQFYVNIKRDMVQR